MRLGEDMTMECRGWPRQDGGLAFVECEKRLQQYLQGQKGNDFARRDVSPPAQLPLKV
jgi:hypothetical protein